MCIRDREQTAFHFDKLYDYLVPEMCRQVQRGCRVMIPFGGGNRSRQGIVMEPVSYTHLFRDQNMLGYRHYADDVVEYFVQKSVANGIDVIRIFDALNDIRNLETSIRAARKEAGAHVQVAISYTTSPVHNIEYFVDYAKRLEETGADSICLKDMAGLLVPYETYDLVKALKETVKIPIQIHSHFTAGISDMVMLKAIEAGADVIDTDVYKRQMVMSMQNQLQKLTEAAAAHEGSAAVGRLKRLFDEGTFVELDRFSCDEVAIGYGTVDGSPVYAFAQNREVCCGAVGKAQAAKIREAYTLSLIHIS